MQKPMIGWREWIQLPELEIARVKVKVDTGARSSSLHAFDVELLKRKKRTMVRFLVHPLQDDNLTTVECIAELIDERWVRSSNGKRELRPTIRYNPLDSLTAISPVLRLGGVSSVARAAGLSAYPIMTFGPV